MSGTHDVLFLKPLTESFESILKTSATLILSSGFFGNSISLLIVIFNLNA